MAVTPAVVLGLNPNGLGLIKSLVGHDIPVIALDRASRGWRDTNTWMSSRTRLCKKIILEPDASDESIVEALLRDAETRDDRSPILPNGDGFVYLLAQHRAQLEPRFRFNVPAPETLELTMNKSLFYDFCVERGIRIPETRTSVTPENVEELGRGLRFPCIVKPTLRDRRWDTEYPKAKALEANDLNELVAQVRAAARTGASLLIQEVIPGPDSELYFSHAYFSEPNELEAMWTGRKLRQYPPAFGTSTLVETLTVPEVGTTTVSIVKELGLTGYVSIEFKRDPRDGSFRLLEVTPARSWYPHYLGVKVGVNLPLIWYRHLLGQPIPSPNLQTTPEHVAWVDEYRDVVAAFEAWGRRDHSLVEWFRSYLTVRAFALFSLRDPLPGLFVLTRLAISVWNLIRRGRR